MVKRALAVAHGESSLSYTAYNVVSNNCEHFASWCRSEQMLYRVLQNIWSTVEACN